MKSITTLIGILAFVVSMAQIPTLSIQKSEKKQDLEISQLTVNVAVVGNVATTTFDVLFFNPMSENLEGELSMPLADGQEICRYALDLNGKLREGVVIEKVKARQTFEAVVRQKIDPGIVNLTKGNSFKTKIFPIPANGVKRVLLAISETLKGDDKNLYYSLPFEASKSIGLFKLDVKVFKNQSGENKMESEFENITFDQRDNAYCLNLERKNFSSSKPLKFTIPRFSGADHQLFTCNFEGETYFYLNVKAPDLKSIIKVNPRKIGVFWDNSFSASKRNAGKELDLLQNYLSSVKGTKDVSVVSFNHRFSQAKTFKINQNASDIIQFINKLHNDGATCFDNLKFDRQFDEILLFSDGVNTIGEGDIKTSGVPVNTITSCTGSNYKLLKKLTEETNGEFIDLNAISGEKALELMGTDQEKFLSCTFNPAEIQEVYPNTPCRVGDHFELAGILKTKKANLQINYGTKSKVTQSQSFEITRLPDAPISRIWASKKIQALQLDEAKNHQEIIQLAQKFNVVTTNTAFIVLDRVEDYVTHGIVPPDELKVAYNKLLANKTNGKGLWPETILQNNTNRIKDLKYWYSNPPRVETKGKQSIQGDIIINVADVRGTDEVSGQDIGDLNNQIVDDGEVIRTQEELTKSSIQVTVSADLKTESVPQNSDASIKILAWMPDAPYLETLRKADEKDLESLYYKLKEENKDRPSFYIQVADFFFEKKMKAQAVRVLSNTLELDLENPELLKVVARRLLQEGEFKMAIKVFEEIKNLRPEEPQSFRDLAQAYQANKQYQEALDTYQFILDRDWERFEGIKDVILNELNCLVSLHKKELNTKKINPEYIIAMPLDIRITLDWSSNENDIDLWVIDPNGEKCFYSNTKTQIGGKISQDFTRGYGPEEFALKTAKRGTYTVYVNYYSESRQTVIGPVTVYASLTTHYGTEQQKTQNIAVQLTENKETRQIGQLEFQK